jgi:hypothetical protein
MPITYRRTHDYKYQLLEDYIYQTDIKGKLIRFAVPAWGITKHIVWLTEDGELTIMAGYAWDGPSGPGIDTKNFMRGSLVHDVIYQLLREKLLPEEFRENADRYIRDICLEDGMSKLRAWWVYHGLRFAGKSAATGPDKKESAPITAGK